MGGTGMRERRGTYLTGCIDDLTIVDCSGILDNLVFGILDSGEITLDISRRLDILFSQRCLA
jgi:hypothetical protein